MKTTQNQKTKHGKHEEKLMKTKKKFSLLKGEVLDTTGEEAFHPQGNRAELV